MAMVPGATRAARSPYAGAPAGGRPAATPPEGEPPLPRPASPAAPPVAADLLAWYDRHRRRLPWRAEPGIRPDPYAVWLSEIMLQQTTVRAVEPYYARFLARWPDVEALAGAPVEDVMGAWAGLGYYSRARNLHACAIAVARGHGGRFPDTEAALRALPGIGAYTAAAIAAIAFDAKATAVDGNVERVMARLHAVEEPLPRARARLRAHAVAATPDRRAGDFAQALMDLGSGICTPRNPRCILCPLRAHCRAAAEGRQAELPRRAPKKAVAHRHGTAFYCVEVGGALLLRRRPPRGLLGGMVELPGTAWERCDADPAPALLAPGDRAAGRVVHVFTHFTLSLDVVVTADAARVAGLEGGACFPVAPDAVDGEALPTLMRRAVALGRAAM